VLSARSRAALGPCSVLGARFSVLGSRFSVLGSRFSVLGSRFSVLGSRFSAPNGAANKSLRFSSWKNHAVFFAREEAVVMRRALTRWSGISRCLIGPDAPFSHTGGSLHRAVQSWYRTETSLHREVQSGYRTETSLHLEVQSGYRTETSPRLEVQSWYLTETSLRLEVQSLYLTGLSLRRTRECRFHTLRKHRSSLIFCALRVTPALTQPSLTPCGLSFGTHLTNTASLTDGTKKTSLGQASSSSENLATSNQIPPLNPPLRNPNAKRICQN
jgi:hypothetical protein